MFAFLCGEIPVPELTKSIKKMGNWIWPYNLSSWCHCKFFWNHVFTLLCKVSDPSFMSISFFVTSYDRFCMYQTDIYFFNNGNNRTMCEIFSILNDVIMVSLSLTLNRFHILLWSFCCWLWPSKCRLGKGFSQHVKRFLVTF